MNKAIVGRNAFAHEAGIHQDGVLKDRRTYEIMRAEDVGAPWNPLVLGKHSGRHAVQKRCADLGFTLEGEELVEVYRAHNEPLHESLEPCAGIDAALAALQQEGRRLGIVTAKRRLTVRLAFDVLPWLEPHFEIVVGAEDTERHKPNPEPLLHAHDLLGAAPGDAAYVGDSPFDVEAAKAAGCFAVAVTWGGIHGEDRLAAQRPDAIVHDTEELLGVL